MQYNSILALTFLMATFSLNSAQAADKAFLTINGVAIPQAVADLYLAQGTANGMPDSAETRARVREDLIRRELVFQAAKGAGFDRKRELVAEVEAATRMQLAQMEATRHALITRAFVADYLARNPVTEAELKAAYEAARAKGGDTEYKVRHILAGSEEEARAAISALKHGAGFDDLARKQNERGMQGRSGDLGWSSPARFVASFAAELKSLHKGQYSQRPVKTEAGFHVVMLDDTRPLKLPSFDEMRPMLKKDAEDVKLAQLTEQLRAKAKIR